MKKKVWLYLGAMALSLAVLAGYAAVDRLRTDSRAPEITVSAQQLRVSTGDPDTALLQGVSAADNADGDVTGSLVVERIRLLDETGRISVRYAAFDAAGNVAKAEREAQYTDYESPRFVLTEPLMYSQNSSVDVLRAVQVRDLLEGDISHRVRITPLDQITAATVGTYDVEFRVTNSLGDTARLVLPLEIYPSGRNQAALKLTDYLVYVEQGSAFEEMDYLKELTVAGETISLAGGIPAACSVQTEGSVDTQVPGVYSVSYKAVCYGAAGYSKLIVVVEG